MFQAIHNAMERCQDLLEKKQSRERLSRYFTMINNQLDRGKRLITNIQNLSEIEKSEMKLTPLKLRSTIEEAIQFVKNNFQEINIQITLDEFEEDLHVKANELLLDVFENVLINSVKHNDKDSIEIEITASEIYKDEENQVRIEIRDNAMGIPDYRKEVIFTEQDLRKSSKGMGIGLKNVAKLIDLFEGKIWVEDRIKGDHSQGSNFIIQLPGSEPSVFYPQDY
jgi:signal transduction histidine kinase